VLRAAGQAVRPLSGGRHHLKRGRRKNDPRSKVIDDLENRGQKGERDGTVLAYWGGAASLHRREKVARGARRKKANV